MKIEIVEATIDHAVALAPRLRERDAAEVYASGGHTPERALTASVNASEVAWTALFDGRPEVMWGAAPYLYSDGKMGVVWLLSSDEMYRVPGRFIQESYNYVSKMFETFDTLFNYVHAANIKSQQWLEMLGFHAVSRNDNYGYAGESFILYARSK